MRQPGILQSNERTNLQDFPPHACLDRSQLQNVKSSMMTMHSLHSFVTFSRDLQTQGRLPLGPFTISPGGGTVPAGGNALISVECTPESDVPRKFEEVN